MPNYDKLTENLTRRGYTVQRFPTARQAADYLDSVIDQTSVAFGGSVTWTSWTCIPVCPPTTGACGTGRGMTGWTGCRRRSTSAR